MSLSCSKSSSWSSAANIREECQILTKRPCHVAFAVLEPGPISFKDLANLMAWAIAAEIHTISLYDVQGRIKDGEKQLAKALGEAQSRLRSSSPPRIHWHPHRREEHLHHKNGHGHGHGHGHADGDPSVNISLLSLPDGKGDIVRTARNLAKNVQSGEISVENINEGLVDLLLETNRDLSDPELLIRLGEVDCNMGFCPWQIRLTEIHSIRTLRDVPFADFFRVLRIYSRCEKRFGK